MSTTHYNVGDEPIPGSGYRLTAFLGRGGFGEVWKASAPGGTEAALKIIRFSSREGHKEFHALQVVKRIRHPNLVPIVGFWLKSEEGHILDESAVRLADRRRPTVVSPRATAELPAEEDETSEQAAELIIAMGLGDKSLFDRLEECQRQNLPGVPDEELMGYMRDSAEAIDFLNSPVHDLGDGPVAIQHCDIKPHNLMIVSGCVQVCDFGLARILGADRATTAAASVAYAAPECLTSGTPSASTDQYSLAISFFELKCGKLPYHEMTLMAAMEAKQKETLDFSCLSDAQRAILRRATSRDPKKRYATCRQMVAALQATMPAAGDRDARATRMAPVVHRQRSRTRRILGALLGTLLVGVGLWLAWQRPWRSDETGTPNEPNAMTAVAKEKSSDEDKLLTPSIAGTDVPNPHADTGSVDDADKTSTAADDLLASGTRALKKKDFAAAAIDLEQATKRTPRDARVFSRLGAARAGLRQYDEAVRALTTAIEIEPAATDYFARGRAYRELQSLDKAIADFAESVRLNPQSAPAQAALGDAYMEKDDAEHAITALSAAVDLCLKDTAANYPLNNARQLRASAYLLAGKNDAAAADLTEVVNANQPEDRGAHALLDALAAAYFEAHEPAKAAQWQKKAIAWAPDAATENSYRQRLEKYTAASKPGGSTESP